MWLSFSPDLHNWGDHTVLLEARDGAWWDAGKIGLSPQPIETADGWLIMYHGVRSTPRRRPVPRRTGVARPGRPAPRPTTRRRMGAWPADDATKLAGDIPNVVFPCGAVLDQASGELRVYYGAADTCVGLATAQIGRGPGLAAYPTRTGGDAWLITRIWRWSEACPSRLSRPVHRDNVASPRSPRDLARALQAADPSVLIQWAAINEATSIHPYGPEVRWRIRQGDPDSYRAAAEHLNAAAVDVVCLQHEFGLYGTWGDPFEDHLTPFLDVLNKPLVTTLHSVLPDPSPSVRAAVDSIVERSESGCRDGGARPFTSHPGVWRSGAASVRRAPRCAADACRTVGRG